MRTTVMFVTAAVLLIGVAAPGAQNLVVNPDFDTDVSGWDPFGGTWSPEDWQDSPSSGSATRTMVTGGTSAPIAHQCVDLPGGVAQEYELSAQVYLPSGQTGTGRTHLSFGWYSGPDCIGQISGGTSSSVSTLGSWTELADTIQPPAGAVSIHFSVILWAQTGGGLQGYTDHVVLSAASIFSDGFEAGDLDAWSGTTRE